MLAGSGSLSRRAILIYTCTIVLPVGAVLWLGVQSFDRQRLALATLTAEKLERAIDAAAHVAATRALDDGTGPIAGVFFTIDNGVITSPRRHAPPPRPSPPWIEEAEHEELDLGHLDRAIALYRQLLGQRAADPLVLSRIARVLTNLGRTDEARETWRLLAAKYPDDRDLSDRPYGIVGALNARDTTGLRALIVGGRWDLSGDQAAFFLSQLDPAPSSDYLDRFLFVEELARDFKAPRALREGEVGSYAFGSRRIFYRAEGAGRLAGLLVDPAWLAALRDQQRRTLGVSDDRHQELWMYGGALAVVLLVLSAGVGLLWRDVSREATLARLRSDFVSGASHDLKTPIALVRLYAETILRQPGLDDEKRREFHRVIVRESARLGRLVDQILAFSRIERHAQQYNLTPGDVAPVIVGIVEDYGTWLERAGFTVVTAIPAEAPMVRFDAAAVSQAVINLLDNAAKYSETARTIAIRLVTRDQHVDVEVEDQGAGIARADQERVFERFYRGRSDTGTGGHGLGLYMVRYIMEAHGGRAEVESAPGRGSTFRLVFPIAS